MKRECGNYGPHDATCTRPKRHGGPHAGFGWQAGRNLHPSGFGMLQWANHKPDRPAAWELLGWGTVIAIVVGLVLAGWYGWLS